MGCSFVFWWSYLWDGHGDVKELSSPSLWDRSGEEQPESIFREQRLFVLLRNGNLNDHYRHTGSVITVIILIFSSRGSFCHLVSSADFHNGWFIRAAGAVKSTAQSGHISTTPETFQTKQHTLECEWLWWCIASVMVRLFAPRGLFLREQYDPLFMILHNISYGNSPRAKNSHENLISKNNISSCTVLQGNMIRQTTSNILNHSNTLL